jgi:hypothetical protein
MRFSSLPVYLVRYACCKQCEVQISSQSIWLLSILECTKTDRRNQDHAHGEEGGTALPQWTIQSVADQFYSLAFISGVKREQAWPVELIATKTVNLIYPMLMA